MTDSPPAPSPHSDAKAAHLALEAVRLALSDSEANPLQTAIDARPAVLAMTGQAGSAEVVHALVDLAMVARTPRAQGAARDLLLLTRALAVGDPYPWLLAASPGAFRPDAGRAEAFQALEARAADLGQLALDHAAAKQEAVARQARLLCWALGEEARAALAPALRTRIAEDAATWSRSRALLWGTEPHAPAADAIARDRSEPALVRAAAILRAARDDLARGEAPRVATLALLREVVAERHDTWSDQWAPVGLFAEVDDSDQIALLSPGAHVHCEGETAAQLTRALLAALDVVPDQASQRAALAANLIRFALGPRARRWPSDFADEVLTPLPSELSDFPRELVETVARKVSPLEWHFDVFHALGGVGLPTDCMRLRRWLGIDPPGPADRPVAVHVDGAMQVIPFELAAERMLVGRVSPAQLARAMAAAFTTPALVALTCEDATTFEHLPLRQPAKSGAPQAARAALDELREAALGEVASTDLVPVLLERLDALLPKGSWERARDAQFALLRALAHALEPGAVIPERFDPLIVELPHGRLDTSGVRKSLARVSPERCDRILRRAEARPRGGPRDNYDDLLSPEARAEVARIRALPLSKLEVSAGELFASIERLTEGVE